MLRIVFTDRDLARVRVASVPDPLWEITNSLDRLQTTDGRHEFGQWHGNTVRTLAKADFRRTVARFLIPLLPRAAYFPDFLTPAEGRESFEAGLDSILRAPHDRVTFEIETLDRLHGAPSWARSVASNDMRKELVLALRKYHDLVIAPHESLIQPAVGRDRVARGRAMLDGGVDALLNSFGPLMRWRPPVLELDYPVTREIHLGGRGLTLVPSYFCWHRPVTLADPDLPPVLIYPLVNTIANEHGLPGNAHAAALIGPTRAAVLAATTYGMTTSEIARTAGISPQTTSHHLNVLRDSKLITSYRHRNTVLHVITPLGTILLAG
ncbi:helix-turn-helix domain-containing protein [Kibdelosporangium philippinense]|uniref:Helix-turn-helix domain-containing protein n=1 Tax=Kibdelosporangium philippinense TaxID=211113 RepID=A0ABS8ZTM6_9PSEU|nr:winged helix-turn-helix domain-containing protein [Kibdelosporangium philippinense]MCE7011090.1 helix-turn-helix domain-containing protein [Kibdelosporangium philippinense]